MESRAAKIVFRDLCYGIPVEVIAIWLQVSAAVALKYKNGSRVPCPAAVELFKLKLEGHVVPDEWHGFRFRGAQFFDPEGKTFSHGLLRAYGLGLQLLREFSRGSLHRTAQVDKIFAEPDLDRPALTHSNAAGQRARVGGDKSFKHRRISQAGADRSSERRRYGNSPGIP